MVNTPSEPVVAEPEFRDGAVWMVPETRLALDALREAGFIAAPFGAPVHAIFDGRVVWASWFRGYGVMAVVDHGGGVHSVYAHLSAVTVANGDDVEKEQQIGLVGDTGPLGGASLYFEIREAGRADDPASWIAPAR